MYKGWISRRGRESIDRGCKPFYQWTDDELKALFKANKENVPSIIYDYLDSVDPNFYRDVFLEAPSGALPEGTFSPNEYHHIVNEDGYIDEAFFYEFTVPEFGNPEEALLKLQEQYAKFGEYKNYMKGVRKYEDWSKALIIEELKSRGYADKIISFANGSSIDFLRCELLTKGDEKIFAYRSDEHRSNMERVVKVLGSVNIEDDYEALKKARQAWRARANAQTEQKAAEKASKKEADAKEPCLKCRVLYLAGPYRKRTKAVAIKKADRFYFKPDELHAKGWSMGEKTFSFKEVLAVLEELPADFDFKAWQSAID